MNDSIETAFEPVPQPQAEQCGQPLKADETLPDQAIRCQDGTVFVEKEGLVTITRSDQPICTVPLSDFLAAATFLRPVMA